MTTAQTYDLGLALVIAQRDAEIERLRAALEEIVRESNGVNKGAVAQKIAIDALRVHEQKTGIEK